MICDNCKFEIDIITSKKYPGETIEFCKCGMRLGDKN